MVKCPKCKEEINYLYYKVTNVDEGIFDLEDWFNSDSNSVETKEQLYFCSNCEELLFYNLNDASDFLKGIEVTA